MALNNADVETEALLSEGRDPVSGNDVPLGAKPEEVRDDIDARVSENEYVIPAYAVRYFGPRFFDELLASAQQGWERIKAGEEEMPDTDMPEPAPREMEFAEGGAVPKPVGGGYGGYGGTGAGFGGFESKTFVNDSTGQQIIIYYYNGKPMSRIPEGFREKGETPVEEQAAQQQATTEDGGGAELDPSQTIYSKPVSEWTTSDFDDYTKSLRSKSNPGKLGVLEKGILGFAGTMIGGTLGGLALPQLVERGTAKQAEAVAKRASEILKSGTDPETGQPLSGEVVKSLNDARITSNYVQENLDSNIIYKSPVTEASVIQQQQDAIAAARADVERKVAQGVTVEEARKGTIYDVTQSDDNDDYTPSAPSTFYGGTAETETSLITSDLSDEDFWAEFEAGTPTGAAATYGSDKDEKDDSKIVCTAMNNSYGFGSYRQAIWLSYSQKHLTKEHEVGYHTLFLPLVDLAYKKNNKVVRKALEHIARHRTKDLRAEMQNGKRDTVGRLYRSVLEPLCYAVGKVKMATQ